jgi:hypothetical protein
MKKYAKIFNETDAIDLEYSLNYFFTEVTRERPGFEIEILQTSYIVSEGVHIYVILYQLVANM